MSHLHSSGLARIGRDDAADAVGFSAVSGHFLSKLWFFLGLGALAVSTICAIALVVARTPVLSELLPESLFPVGLVLHVTLATIVWFLAFACSFWTAAAGTKRNTLSLALFGVATVGCVALLVSPFVASGSAYLSNYVPLLNQPPFLVGLVAFVFGTTATGLLALPALGRICHVRKDPVALGLLLSVVVLVMAVASSVWSCISLPHGNDLQRTFEYGTWAPGHLVQFVFTLLLLVIWIKLADTFDFFPENRFRWLNFLFLLTALPAILAFCLHFVFPVTALLFRDGFTRAMAYGTWPGPLMLGLYLIWRFFNLKSVVERVRCCGRAIVWRKEVNVCKEERQHGECVWTDQWAGSGPHFSGEVGRGREIQHSRDFLKGDQRLVVSYDFKERQRARLPTLAQTALVFSMILFFVGCVLGALICADNTVVPAHYHGTVGAVTMGFMGAAYLAVDKNGAVAVRTSQCRLQLVVYFLGLLLLISGLTWVGGHGAQRKTILVVSDLDVISYWAGSVITGVGGLLAICGSVLFVVNILRCWRVVIPPGGQFRSG